MKEIVRSPLTSKVPLDNIFGRYKNVQMHLLVLGSFRVVHVTIFKDDTTLTLPGSKMESRKLALAFVSVEEMIQMKPTEQYFHMAPFVFSISQSGIWKCDFVY